MGILPVPGVVGPGVGPEIAPAVLKWARGLGLNVESATTQHLLRNLETPVRDFISKFVKGSVNRQFPTQFLNKTVRDAL